MMMMMMIRVWMDIGIKRWSNDEFIEVWNVKLMIRREGKKKLLLVSFFLLVSKLKFKKNLSLLKKYFSFSVHVFLKKKEKWKGFVKIVQQRRKKNEKQKKSSKFWFKC